MTDAYLHGLVVLIGLFFIVNMAAISTWALAGATLTSFLAKRNRIVRFSGVMAALLVVSMARMQFGAAKLATRGRRRCRREDIDRDARRTPWCR